MQGLVLKIRAWWNIADKTAKTVTIVGVVFLLITLVVTFTLSSQPDYAVCYASLTSADAGRVINKLKDLKVPFRIGADGTSIEVPKGQRDEVRMKLAADGLPAESSGGIGNGWLDKSSIARTKDQEQIVNRVMLEEELQKTIQSLQPVQSARVHITSALDGPFVDQQRPATADVVVHLTNSQRLASEQVNGIVHIVSRSVPGLDKKHVSVIDGDGTVLYDGSSDEPGGTGIYSVKRREEMEYANHLREEIERHLSQVLGPGKALVNVQCSMNFDTENSDKLIHTPVTTDAKVPGATPEATSAGKTLVPLTASASVEGYANGKNAAAGPTGSQMNVAGGGGGKTTTTSDGKTYSDTKLQNQYAINQEHLTTTKAPGKVETLNVAVLLDDTLKAPQQTAVANYVKGTIGVPPTGTPPPGYNVTIAPITFDQEQKKANQKAAAAVGSPMMDKLFGLAPSLALIISAVLVMRALGKPVIKLQVPELPEGMAPVLPRPGAPVSVGGEAQPQVVVQPRVSLPQQATIEVAPIPERFDMAKEQIARMVNEKPDTVALLLKSWMMEDRN